MQTIIARGEHGSVHARLTVAVTAHETKSSIQALFATALAYLAGCWSVAAVHFALTILGQ